MMRIGSRTLLWLSFAFVLPGPQRTAADDAKVAAVAPPAPAPDKPAAASGSAPRVARDKPAAVGGGVPALRLNKRSLANLAVDPPLTPEVNAGVIPRAALQAELARGIGYFLRQVHAQPAFVKGRFAGWRLLDLYRARTDVRVLVLQPGDTVVLVNGRAIERPEEFKAVWDGLNGATELLLDIKRAGHATKLRYTIAD